MHWYRSRLVERIHLSLSKSYRDSLWRETVFNPT
jgi:hypothetical protein